MSFLEAVKKKNGKRDPPVPEVIIERLFWLVKRLPLNINMKWIRILTQDDPSSGRKCGERMRRLANGWGCSVVATWTAYKDSVAIQVCQRRFYFHVDRARIWVCNSFPAKSTISQLTDLCYTLSVG
jgi:hypothetical protein